MYYHLLGQLDHSFFADIKTLLDQQQITWTNRDQTWDYSPALVDTLRSILGAQSCDLQLDSQGMYSVKLFFTRPGQASPIHKDGLRAQSALNICVDSNPGDWIRWWDDSIRDQLVEHTVDQQQRASRNLRSGPVDQVSGWVCEFRPRPGQIYLVNTDRYHAYHCAGPRPRRVVQTKFRGWPSIQQLKHSLSLDLIAMNPC